MGMFRLLGPALCWLDAWANADHRSRWLHDARAPLAAIVGVVDLMMADAGQAQREHLVAIRATACALLARIDGADAPAPAPVGEREDTAGAVRLGGPRVLVVIEQEHRRRDWLGVLADRGYTPYGAIDALDALRQLTLEPFDAALIDGELACLDAGLLARAIRSRPGVSRSMPIGAIGVLDAGEPFDFAVRRAESFTPRDTAPTVRVPHRRARARARG